MPTPVLEHTVRVQLRWRDMDMLGHLNQSVYHELLEEGRAALMTELVRRVGVNRTHGAFVLVHVDLDYHTEVRKDHGEVTVVVRPRAGRRVGNHGHGRVGSGGPRQAAAERSRARRAHLTCRS